METIEILEEYRHVIEDDSKTRQENVLDSNNLENVMDNVITSLTRIEDVLYGIRKKLNYKLNKQPKKQATNEINSVEKIVTSSENSIVLLFPLQSVKDLKKVEKDEYLDVVISYIEEVSRITDGNFFVAFRYIISDMLMSKLYCEDNTLVSLQRYRLFSNLLYDTFYLPYLTYDEYKLELKKAALKAHNRCKNV